MLFGKHKPCVITVAALLSGVLLSFNAAALGLGEITSSSLLGQPLQAEINVVDSAREYRAQDLLVQKLDITRAQQFGFDALSVNYDLVLELDNTDAGVVVRVASRRPVLEPFINFQVELQWSKGSLIREYTLFLDPPALAATAVDSRPAASGSGAGATTGPGNISNNVSKTAAGSAGAAAVASRRTAVTALTADSYRVQSGDSLSAIARRWSEGRGESPARVSQWLFQHNSQAFIGGDINRLKAGASLQLPQASDLPLQLGGESGSVGAVSAPAAAVQSESGAAGGNRAWMNNLPTREPASAVSPVPAPERDTDQAAGMLRLSEKSEGSTPSFAELDAESPEALKAYLDSTRESIDRVQRDNADLRRQIDTIENSDYINMLKELVELQAQQLEALNRQRSGAGSPAATTVVANPAAGGGVAAAATPPPGQSLLDINSATQPAQTPLANRDAYKGWAALGLLLLALILLALIIRRLWEQQGSRYKTRELPIAVAPITVTAGAAKASAAATPSRATNNATSSSGTTNTGAAKSKAGTAPGKSVATAAVQSAAEREALPDLLDDDFEITDADLQTLGPLELDIDTGEVVPSPLTADAPKSKAKPEAKHEPAVKPPAKAPTGSPFEDLIPQMTHSIDDDWDELFDAIIGLDGGMENGIESDLEDGIDAGTFGGEPGAKDGVKDKLHKSKVKGLDKREGKNKGQDSFELSLEFESEPSATGPVANVPTAARKTVSKKAAGKLQMKPGNKPAEKPRKR
ncbi:hypothetical protein G8764_05135 [Pseudomaricurvus alcaniphilus]|uniref:type IV pilus assembly protein FimV n=1 Tax=Pseudomaricurvus alcaniphilus TaxID=1166482 RepID=UPI001408E236|nr:hypothetical protein [Pseudomaricurvus alcaniphilus]NHN36672.1 hypothetical protein [Pseudomaricurvus alcaniphilus]